MSWEVWAALCEVLCRPGEATQITPASLWKRAEELQSAALCSSNCCSNEHNSLCGRYATATNYRTDRDNGGDASRSQNVCGYNTNKRNVDSDDKPNGYDVVTFVADERPLQNTVRNQASVGGKFFLATSPPTQPTATKRRLHRTLATSQRVWSREHPPQPQIYPQNRVKNHVRSVSPQKASIVVSPLGGSIGDSCPGTNETNLRPATEPPSCCSNSNAPSSPSARPASAEHRPPTTNGALPTALDSSSNMRGLPTLVGAWGAVAEGAEVGADRNNAPREMVMQMLALDNSQKETSSAKRKASRYKACMLEAQVGITILDDYNTGVMR